MTGIRCLSHLNRQQSIVCPRHTISTAKPGGIKQEFGKNKTKNNPGLDPKQNSASHSAVSPASAKTPEGPLVMAVWYRTASQSCSVWPGLGSWRGSKLVSKLLLILLVVPASHVC